MKTRSAARALTLSLALVSALTLAAAGSGAQVEPPVPGPIPPTPIRVVSLSIGCNNVALTYPDGTPVGVVIGSIDPDGALYAIWRLNSHPQPPVTTPTYEGYAPAAPQASDLQGVNFLEPVFLCVSVPATITMPAVMPYPYPIPMPEPTVIPLPSESPGPS
jgi:hypothetical protein